MTTSTIVSVVLADPYEDSPALWDAANTSEIDLEASTSFDASQDEAEQFNNWWAMLALVLVLGTAAGNILVCMAITWERRLQNVTNYFLMSLAITDLMVAVLVMPLGILTLVRGELFPAGLSLTTDARDDERSSSRVNKSPDSRMIYVRPDTTRHIFDIG